MSYVFVAKGKSLKTKVLIAEKDVTVLIAETDIIITKYFILFEIRDTDSKVFPHQGLISPLWISCFQRFHLPKFIF